MEKHKILLVLLAGVLLIGWSHRGKLDILSLHRRILGITGTETGITAWSTGRSATDRINYLELCVSFSVLVYEPKANLLNILQSNTELSQNHPALSKMLRYMIGTPIVIEKRNLLMTAQVHIWELRDSWDHHMIFVACCGTNTKRNVMTDLYDRYEEVGTNPTCIMHAGFMGQYWFIDNEVKETLLTILQKQKGPTPRSTLVFTGHSLGGAMGTIMTAYLLTDEEIATHGLTLHCYSFGCPRLGDLTFRKVFSDRVGGSPEHSNRVFHEYDPVALVPIRHTFVHVLGGLCIPLWIPLEDPTPDHEWWGLKTWASRWHLLVSSFLLNRISLGDHSSIRYLQLVRNHSSV
jgi:hypothetical protein